MVIPVLTSAEWQDYELLDCGDGEKLESFANFTIVRPDPRAIWPKRLSTEKWQAADAVFDRNSQIGKWRFKTPPPKNWQVKYRDLLFHLEPTDFRHVGIFPEQAVNWDWLTEKISNRPLKILNLFAYTGAATVAAAKAGAAVTHVDASKSAISWAHRNAELNNLSEDKTRWILEDVAAFVEREIRRGSRYDGIILDPPRFGHGAKGEIWKLQDDLSMLIRAANQLLENDAQFLLLNIYTADLSSVAAFQLVGETLKDRGGSTEVAELALGEKNSDRLLPGGITVRWTA